MNQGKSVLLEFFEPFIENIVAGCSKWAYDDVRERLYSNNRDHVHIKAIYLQGDGEYDRTLVEPRAYL